MKAIIMCLACLVASVTHGVPTMRPKAPRPVVRQTYRPMPQPMRYRYHNPHYMRPLYYQPFYCPSYTGVYWYWYAY